ncbi:uncharacterized protein TNCV_380421 [Trichonephila clavipes]|nr:uncharacterized protein TNCV_380421 [Trichonephila clavipes]
MIANYVNDQRDKWDQFLREFAYAIRTAVNKTTEKTPAELFLGRKLITPFQKLVMSKYYSKRRRDVRIKVNDWVLLKTHPLSSAAQKVVAKFKPKFEGPYRVLEVKHNNLGVWRAGKRLKVNVDQVRLYHQRKSDENEIRAGSSDNNGSKCKSSSFEGVRPRSNMSQYSRNNDEKRTHQRGPVRSRGRREQQYTPYSMEQGRSCGLSARSRRAQQQQRQERSGGSNSRRSQSLEVLIGDVNYRTH